MLLLCDDLEHPPEPHAVVLKAFLAHFVRNCIMQRIETCPDHMQRT